ncbi:Protein of unknown function [Roseovarius nanhaiticus]|uniref:DUF3168 domain-containing protein n=1 Tax=Roseovarius nanhaiticus TaxID=573024 RepID=A0A1N7EL04_9RHOB|nr:DUF3168 domain-containing protein [Roseovarius nanhaiticus]SEK72665.1 Protein of unknown function [Roseovarius nanhaiticus]SIR88625.1 Protein of unknown function [Roseovarius nanhaiticus]
MSYGGSAALQSAVYGQLMGDPDLSALVGGAIYDAPPAGTLPPLYVTLGPEDVRDRSDATGGGAWHRFTVSVMSDAAGFAAAKAAAAAVSDALSDAELSLDRGHLAGLHFYRARARRDGALRRIDLTFRARISDAA